MDPLLRSGQMVFTYFHCRRKRRPDQERAWPRASRRSRMRRSRGRKGDLRLPDADERDRRRHEHSGRHCQRATGVTSPHWKTSARSYAPASCADTLRCLEISETSLDFISRIVRRPRQQDQPVDDARRSEGRGSMHQSLKSCLRQMAAWAGGRRGQSARCGGSSRDSPGGARVSRHAHVGDGCVGGSAPRRGPRVSDDRRCRDVATNIHAAASA